MLKPQKKHAPEGIFVTENYIGTGHWAARKHVMTGTIRAVAAFQTQETADAVYGPWGRTGMDDAKVENVFSSYKSSTTEYHRTPVMMAGPYDTVLYRADDGSTLWINRNYADLLELETVRSDDGNKNSPCYSTDGDVVVMPVRDDLPAWFAVKLKQAAA